MSTVHQHPDGLVFVRGESATYQDTPENFASDFGVTLPMLPPGMNERIYDQGRRHVCAGDTDTGAQIVGGEMPWPLGDQIIAGLAAALAKQKQRDEH